MGAPASARRMAARAALVAAALALQLQGAAAQGCIPLCDYDAARTGQCHVSRRYAAALLERFEDPTWGGMAAQLVACEVMAGDQCASAPNCELDPFGACSAARSWAITQLAAPAVDGGAGLGADRCGAIGHMLATSAACIAANGQTACEEANCVWDASAGSCSFQHESALLILRRDYKEQLARVGLRRTRCAGFTSSATCTGDCAWSQGRCSLRTLDALLSVVGSDCPLHVLLRRHAACDEGLSAVNETECLERQRPDRLPECTWRDGRCEAHPIALEFDLVQYLGLQSRQVDNLMRRAQSRCQAIVNATECNFCAAPISDPFGGAVRLRPRVLALASWAASVLALGALRA